MQYTVEIKIPCVSQARGPEMNVTLVSRTGDRLHLFDLVLEALQMVGNEQATITITQSKEKNSSPNSNEGKETNDTNSRT